MSRIRNTLNMGQVFKVRDCVVRNRLDWDENHTTTAEACRTIEKETGIAINPHQLRNLWRQDPSLRWRAGHSKNPGGGRSRGGRASGNMTVGKARMIWKKIRDSETGELLSADVVQEIDDLFESWLDGKEAG